MKITAVLQAWLLVTLSYAENSSICRETLEKPAYYIYNVNVVIDAYYCSYTNEDDSRCDKFYRRNTENAADKCKSGALKGQRRAARLCKMPAHVNLLKDVVTFADNKSCVYSQQNCYDENISKDLFWTYTDLCQKISFLGWKNYSVWTSVQDKTMFIQKDSISLILIEQMKLCKFRAWKTNYDGIIASESFISSSNSAASLPNKFQSNLTEFCSSKKSNQQSSVVTQTVTNLPKKWHVYKYPTNVTIHVCLKNLERSCEEMDLGETVLLNKTNLIHHCENVCDSPSCQYEKSGTRLCKKTLQVDLEKNSLREPPSECKYSEEVCKSLNIAWRNTNPCSAVQKLYEGYEENCRNRKCVMLRNNPNKLSLVREGQLCGENVWYSDQHQIVASEKELQFSPPKTSMFSRRQVDDILTRSEEIDSLRNTVRFLLFFVLFCVLWYLFNVVVNLLSLRKLNKTLTLKKRVRLINCMSQSLTTHYLSSSWRGKQLGRAVPSVPPPELYESVDNELYNKPWKLTFKK